MENKEQALVYCEGAFKTTNGKTAHGLVRFSDRFEVAAVIDSRCAGEDAGMILDAKSKGIPVVATLEDGLKTSTNKGKKAESMVIGLAPDGGRLPEDALPVIKRALNAKLNIYCGLHDYLTDKEDLVKLAAENKCILLDIRKPPERKYLHFFTGKIEEVTSLKIAVLGTDSAIGKRTTAWRLVHALRESGSGAELIGTGQTAWLQGARYSIILDSLVNDFLSGEIEHVIHEAWKNEHPDVLVLEGQGSLLNPAYPGGFELLAAGRPDVVILQHAPLREEYDGFAGYKIHPLDHQIRAIELISGRKVIAVTLNHENMDPTEIGDYCERTLKETGIPAFDVLAFGADGLLETINPYLNHEPGRN